MADDARLEVEEGQEVVRHTIVGGRPRARMKRKISIPIGIEKVLVRAAGDEGFRSALFTDREKALGSAGYKLLDSERSILKSVPDLALASMIDSIDLKAHTKRRFARGVTKVAFATAAMTAMVTAGEACTGAEPDMPQEDTLTIDVEEPMADTGVLPDLYEPPEEAVDTTTIEIEDTMTSRGMIPDIPEKPGD
jgi:hypothetical protein